MKDYEMTDEPRETIDVRLLTKLDKETSQIMKSEYRTGITLTVIYFSFVLFIPLMNWYNSGWAFSNMWGGMSYSWFLTAIVAMAMAFIIAWVHTWLYERRLRLSSKNESASDKGGYSA